MHLLKIERFSLKPEVEGRAPRWIWDSPVSFRYKLLDPDASDSRTRIQAALSILAESVGDLQKIHKGQQITRVSAIAVVIPLREFRIYKNIEQDYVTGSRYQIAPMETETVSSFWYDFSWERVMMEQRKQERSADQLADALLEALDG